LSNLTEPKRSLLVVSPGLDGYLEFDVRDDGSIEMEIMEGCDNDFATVDIATAARVIDTAMTDTRALSLRRKLDSLPIDWIA
jgi:hypothetical protein